MGIGRPLIDMTGQRFGRLVVIERVFRPGNTYWRCKCDCGNEVVMYGHGVRKGGGCGCLVAETSRKLGKATRRHGMARSPTWKAWSAMKDRCLCPTNKDFHKYGGRGIKIAERWLVFENFFADMGLKPEGKSLDRIDVNGDYGPENCRWADMATQSANQRRWQDPDAKAAWLNALHEGQKRGYANRCAAQKRRWERWRAERSASS